jgi:hypothetical protein
MNKIEVLRKKLFHYSLNVSYVTILVNLAGALVSYRTKNYDDMAFFLGMLISTALLICASCLYFIAVHVYHMREVIDLYAQYQIERNHEQDNG